MTRIRSRKLQYPSGLSSMLSTIKDKMIVGRVTDIILDKEHPDFNSQGGWSSIGTIFFEENDLQGSNNNTPAKPFFPQTSAYPLINELVLLFSLPNKNIGANTSSETYYYINVISIWNSPHHNAYPNPITPNTPPSANKDYFQTSAGSPVRRTDSGSLLQNGNSIELNSPTNDYQKTFLERDNINPLLPFPGDIIYEGRWGNSIRFGSTAKPPKSDVVDKNFVNNEWSEPTEKGKNGDPIIIIRNGQTYGSNNGWECITEDINLDQSSIYLTSTQKLKNFKVAGNENYGAFPSTFKLTPPSLYTNPQVAINSNRVVINAKKDSILLSANNVLSVSVGDSVGITTPAFYVGSNEVKLGGNDAKEPILKGNITISLLKSLVESIDKLAKILEVEKNWPQGALVTSNNSIAKNVQSTLKTLKDQLDLDESKSDSLKSYTSKVK